MPAGYFGSSVLPAIGDAPGRCGIPNSPFHFMEIRFRLKIAFERERAFSSLAAGCSVAGLYKLFLAERPVQASS
jgi:hypothetical protein